MKSIGSLVLGIILTLTVPTTARRAAAMVAALGDQTQQAKELLEQARQALGGQKLDNIQSLSIDCKLQRAMGDDQVSGDARLEFLLPDKFMQTETINLPMGDATLTRIIVVNGDQTWEDSNTSGSGTIVIKKPSDDPRARQSRQNQLRNEKARSLLSLLLKSPAEFEFAYAGEAQADDGSADVIDVKGPANFAARLFLDKKSHYPLMMSYKAVAPRIITKSFSNTVVNREQAEKHAADTEQHVKEAEQEAAKTPASQNESEYQVRFADYKAVDGVMLPHKITRAIDGKVNEELEVQKYKINPPMKPDRFDKKK